MRIRVKHLLQGYELKLIRDALIEVDERGVVVSIGRYSGERAVDLGAVLMMPQFVNSHVHVLDLELRRYFYDHYIDDVVGAPHGVKYLHLRRLRPEDARRRLYHVFRSVKLSGTGCIVPFIEHGLKFVRDVLEVSRELGVKVIPFVEPSVCRLVAEEGVDQDLKDEVLAICKHGFNVALVSPLNYSADELKLVRSYADAFNVKVAAHVSETHETHLDGDVELCVKYLRPDVVIHGIYLTDDDVEALRSFIKVFVVTPRSNAYLVGRLPDVLKISSRGIPVVYGTDNVGLVEPDVVREVQIVYYVMRLRGVEVDELQLLRSITTVPSMFWSVDFGVIDQGRELHAITISTAGDPEHERHVAKQILVSHDLDIVHVIDCTRIVEHDRLRRLRS